MPVPSVPVSMVITEGPVLNFTFGKQSEENGTKYINSSSDAENSLPLSDSVFWSQTFSNDGPNHSWNRGKCICDAQEDTSVRRSDIQMVDAKTRRAKAC